MQPKTLEEALAIIASQQVKIDTVIKEKKELVKIFDEKDKEEMTETERKMVEAIEKESGKTKDLENQLAEERVARQKIVADQTKREQDRVNAQISERIAKASKGDAEIAKKLEANIALLDKMPRNTDSEIDTVVNSAYNLMGSGSVNPLASISNTGGGIDVNLDKKDGFGETPAGITMGNKLGMSFAKEAPKIETAPTK